MYSSRSLPVANTRHVMPQWPNQSMLKLPETNDQGVVTASGCSFKCLYLWCRSVAQCCAGCEIITWAFRLEMGVGWFSRLLRGVGVVAIPDVGVNTMQRIESVCNVSPAAGMLWLLLPVVAVGVLIAHCCAVDRMDAMHWVKAGMRYLFCEYEVVEFWPWTVKATKLLPCENTIAPTGMKTRLLPTGSWEFNEGPRCCCMWRLARLWIMYTTGVVSGCGLWNDNVRHRYLTLSM